MQPVALEAGALVAWLDGADLFAIDGHPIGFIRGRGVFSYVGELQGYYQNTAFRDMRGRLVALVHRAGPDLKAPAVQRRQSVGVPTDWPPQVPSLDQWSPDWRSVFGAHAVSQVEKPLETAAWSSTRPLQETI